jgi:hypothetical protein
MRGDPGALTRNAGRAEHDVPVSPWPMVVTVVVVEVLALSGVLPTWPGITHEVALPPVDLTNDLGVLLTRATSAPWFAFGLLAALAGRVTLLAFLLGPSRRTFRLAATFYAVALVPAYLAAQLIAASEAILYALLFWAGLIVAVLAALLLAPLPWTSRGVLGGLGRSVMRGARMPTVFVYLVALAALGGLVRLGGDAAALGGVPVSAFLTLVAARRLANPGPRPVPFRVAGIALIVVVLVLVVVRPAGTSRSTAAAPAWPGSLLLVPGIDTSSGHGTLYDFDPRTIGYSCANTYYFSYLGPGHGAPQAQAVCPIRTGTPYQRTDTERPLPDLVSSFRAQLAPLPGPVTIVTHSSGGWIAWKALASSPPSTARQLVMFAPLTGATGYPPAGASGAGVVGGAGTRLVAAIGRKANFSTFNPNAPLAAEVLGSPDAVNELYAIRLPAGIRALAVPAAYDLPLLVGQTAFPDATRACPTRASHSALVKDPSTAEVVQRFLAGLPLPGCGPWRTWQGSLAAGFRVPNTYG